MRDRLNHRTAGNGVVSLLKSVCALHNKSHVTLLGVLLLLAPVIARAQDREPAAAERLRYTIKLAINFDEHTFTGIEKVHWVNHGDHATSTIFFHLYPNMRP